MLCIICTKYGMHKRTRGGHRADVLLYAYTTSTQSPIAVTTATCSPAGHELESRATHEAEHNTHTHTRPARRHQTTVSPHRHFGSIVPSALPFGVRSTSDSRRWSIFSCTRYIRKHTWAFIYVAPFRVFAKQLIHLESEPLIHEAPVLNHKTRDLYAT